MNSIGKPEIAAAVRKSFSDLGLEPREGQSEACENILENFLINGYKYIVLNAPTGAGKSIVGAIVSLSLEKLESLKIRDDFGGLSSITLMHQNILVEQYRQTFEGTDYKVILGAENYNCGVLEKLGQADQKTTADHCVRKILAASQKEELLNICNNECLFMESRRWLSNSRHVVSNYTYFFTLKTFRAMSCPRRYLAVLDEAHVMNDVYINFATISVDELVLNTLLKELSPYSRMRETRYKINVAISKLTSLPMIDKKEVDPEACERLISDLLEIYSSAFEFFTDLANEFSTEETIKEYTEFNKLAMKYSKKLGQINTLRTFKYRPSYSFTPDPVELEVKPLFMEDMFKRVFGGAEKVLLMSATISDLLISRTCNIPADEILMISMDSRFPRENKEIIFYDLLNLNWETLQKKEVVNRVCSNVESIVECHAATERQRGIILVNSFDLCRTVSDRLHTSMDPHGVTIFEHKQGTKVVHTLEAFKAFKGDAAVLISPSIFEGVDLPDDLSRFQILVKVPFASLADARIRLILKEYKDIYNLMAIMKIVQGCGRSVRSKTDFASTYILDANIQRLWFSPANVWRNQFLLVE